MAVLLYKGFIGSITEKKEDIKEVYFNWFPTHETYAIYETASDLNTLQLRFILAIDNWMLEVRKWPIEEIFEFTCNKLQQATSVGKAVFKLYKALSPKYEIEAEDLEFFLVAEGYTSHVFPFLTDSEVSALEEVYCLRTKSLKDFKDLDDYYKEFELTQSYRMIPWDSVVLLLRYEQNKMHS